MQANGIGTKTIAKKLNLSKNTVKKYMRSNEPPHFNTPLKEKLIDGYEEKIRQILIRNISGQEFTLSLSSWAIPAPFPPCTDTSRPLRLKVR